MQNFNNIVIFLLRRVYFLFQAVNNGFIALNEIVWDICDQMKLFITFTLFKYVPDTRCNPEVLMLTSCSKILQQITTIFGTTDVGLTTSSSTFPKFVSMYGNSICFGILLSFSLALETLILSLFFTLSRNLSRSFLTGSTNEAADKSLCELEHKLSLSLKGLYFPSIEWSIALK